jgi:hypothetical protein
MKIRAGFVTNSSSVSYIVTMHEEMAEFVWRKNLDYCESPGKARVYEALRRDLRERGTRSVQADSEMISVKYDFEKKKDCLYEESLPQCEGKTNYAALSDAQLWGYIFGEYFVKGRLASELKGFGSVQVPRDKDKLAAKLKALTEKQDQNAVCAACGKCPSDRRIHHADSQAQ